MQQPRNEEKKRADVRLRVDWFASVLGDEWKTDGDGIYRRVPEPNSPKPTEPSNESSLQDVLNDALSPSARLQHESEQGAGPEKKGSPDANESFRRRR